MATAPVLHPLPSVGSPLEDALAGRLGRGALHAFFQPATTISDGRVAAVETLCRWEDAGGRLIAASRLLAAARAAGVMAELAAWTVAEAARAAAVPSPRPHPPILVNVSAEQLGELRDLLAAARASAGLPPGRLGIEVAEETVATAGAIASVLEGIARDGAPVFLDRFGGAGASLCALRDLPLAGVKLHRSLVAALGADPTADAVVEGAVLTARRLGITTVADGVEDADRLRAAAAAGFDLAQGFALTRPVPLAGLERVLASSPAASGRSGPAHVGVRAAADSLGISESTVRRWVDSGRLHSVRTAGGHRRVRRADVERLARPESAAVRLTLPFAAQPAVASLLDDGAGDLLAAAWRALYRGRTCGWFGTPRGQLLGVAWLERMAAGVRSGDPAAAWGATQDYLALAQLGGAPVIERFLFLERVGIALVQLAIDRHVSREDIAGIRRLIAWLQQRLLAAVGAP